MGHGLKKIFRIRLEIILFDLKIRVQIGFPIMSALYAGSTRAVGVSENDWYPLADLWSNAVHCSLESAC